MPPLSKPTSGETILLPRRTAAVAGRADVLVVGGGPAGLGAALGAAVEGAKVIVAEQYGFLGGNATVALVTPIASYFIEGARRDPTGDTGLFPADQTGGRPAIGGSLAVFVKRLVEAGGAIAPGPSTGFTVPFDPEVFKLVALDLLDETGVDFLFHAMATDSMGSAGPEAVIFETKSGPVAIRAGVVVDCTGDGDVAARAGAPYDVGREEDGLVQPMTLLFRVIKFKHAAFDAYVRDHPGQWKGVLGLWDLIDEATKAGELEMPREDLLFFGTPHQGEVAVNSTRVTKVLGTDVWDLTRAEWESRRQMRQLAAFMRKYVPGFDESYVVQSGTTVCVRETRRITGEYQLTGEDVLAARKFDDAIAKGTYPLDIHNPVGHGTRLQHLPPGEAYDIPLRCLLPRGVDRLLVAGRCISGTHEAQSSYRVMPISMATGQAAGVCGALAAKRRVSPRDVPARDVRDALRKQGAIL